MRKEQHANMFALMQIDFDFTDITPGDITSDTVIIVTDDNTPDRTQFINQLECLIRRTHDDLVMDIDEDDYYGINGKCVESLLNYLTMNGEILYWRPVTPETVITLQ